MTTGNDIKRLNYYERQYLRARDFQDEQAYHIEMRRRHMIAHHLWGVVAGLEITQDPDSKIWSVGPGMAIDGFGREIILFDPEPLNVNSVADVLKDESRPAMLKIWIGYQSEKTTRPPAGYEQCGTEDEFIRTREAFQLVYSNDPPFDLNNTADPADEIPENRETWPQPFQDLPDDAKKARWPVYLATVTWDADPDNPSKNVITSAAFVDPIDNKMRRHVGAVAAEIEVPNIRLDDSGDETKHTWINNTLTVRGRFNERPLATDKNRTDDDGVNVKLEGSLEVDRRLNVIDSVGIGIGGLVKKADTPLQVAGGTAAALTKGSGYAVIGKIDDKNLVLDDHAILARKLNATTKQLETSSLHLQVKGGDLVVHDEKTGAEVVVTDSGNVGIGTKDPLAKLNVFNSEKNPDYGDEAVIAAFRGGYAEGDGWNRNRLVVENTLPTGEASLDLRLDDRTGSERGTHLYQRREHFGIWRSKVGTRLAIDNTGNVGIGTVQPAATLNVVNNTVNTDYSSQAVIASFHGGCLEGDGWNRNRLVVENASSTGEASLDLRLNDTSGSARGTHLYQRAAHFGIWRSAVGTRLAIDNAGNVGIGTTQPAATLDVYGRIMRKGSDFSAVGFTSHGAFVGVPWGDVTDWNIFVSPKVMGEEENLSEGDNALLKIECYAVAGAGGWTITARYKFKYWNSSLVNGVWRNGTANYILVPR